MTWCTKRWRSITCVFKWCFCIVNCFVLVPLSSLPFSTSRSFLFPDISIQVIFGKMDFTIWTLNRFADLYWKSGGAMQCVIFRNSRRLDIINGRLVASSFFTKLDVTRNALHDKTFRVIFRTSGICTRFKNSSKLFMIASTQPLRVTRCFNVKTNSIAVTRNPLPDVG